MSEQPDNQMILAAVKSLDRHLSEFESWTKNRMHEFELKVAELNVDMNRGLLEVSKQNTGTAQLLAAMAGDFATLAKSVSDHLRTPHPGEAA